MLKRNPKNRPSTDSRFWVFVVVSVSWVFVVASVFFGFLLLYRCFGLLLLFDAMEERAIQPKMLWLHLTLGPVWIGWSIVGYNDIFCV